MVPLRRRVFAGALGCVLTVASLDAGFVLPPIDGELSGEFLASKLAGAPTLRWRVASGSSEAGAQTFELTIEGAGTRLVGRGVIDALGDGTWVIEDGELDAAQWFPSAVSQIGEMAEGVAVTGRVVVTGGGEIERGELRGVIQIGWVDGSVRHEAQGWTLEGVSFEGEFAIAAGGASIRSTRPLELSVRTISTARFGARALSVRAVLNEDRTLALSEARIEVAGGEVTVDPAVIALSPFAAELNLRITNVGLQDVAALVPTGLSESRGRINGAVTVGWSQADGFKLGGGNLVLGQTEPAMVRLAPTPGFLTDHVPARFELLPAWLGPVARWFRPENPAYAEMSEIELGRAELRIEGLSVQLTPEGDREGRTARVRVTARPVRTGSMVELVTFEVNVAGPLSEVLRLGMNESFSVGMR